ncbi:MAG: hypothetical protein AAB449_03835 [Patescibacteria group bacterium]
MAWWEILALVVIGFLVFKFLVKPIFKIVGIIILALIAWWLYQGF